MDNNMSVLVSVIIPVYNGEKYIRESLASVLNQSWKNLEILVIDDGSTDTTAEILREFERKDGRIRTIHKEKNMQLFHARMTGIENSKGDYIMFLDADDLYSEDYVEALLSAVTGSNAELALCDNYLLFKDGSSPKDGVRLPGVKGRRYLRSADIEKDLYTVVLSGTRMDQSVQVVWSKIYKRDLIERALPWLNKVKQPMIYFEDVLYSAILLHLSKCSVYTDRGCYYYRMNPSSSMKQDFMGGLNKIITGQLEMITQVRSFLNETKADPEIINLFENWRDKVWKTMELRYAVYYRSRNGTKKRDGRESDYNSKGPGKTSALDAGTD